MIDRDIRDDTTEHDGQVLMGILYDELRELAAARMRKLRPGQTLQPTALVHEVYLRLQRRGDVHWNGRRHFFGIAALAMRDILVDNARRKAALRRGGDLVQVDMPFELAADGAALSAAETLDLGRALEAMRREYPDHAELVALRYFAGMTAEEAGTVLGLAQRTLMRRWSFARGWLGEYLSK